MSLTKAIMTSMTCLMLPMRTTPMCTPKAAGMKL